MLLDDFAQIRRHDYDDVVRLLNIKKTWLKRWVEADLVPCQRSGARRGVWFTLADIVTIGHRLPELMTHRQADARASVDRAPELAVDAQAAGREADLERFRDLRALPTRPSSP